MCLCTGVSVRVLDAQDQHGCSSQQHRDQDPLQDPPDPLQVPGAGPDPDRTGTTQVPVLPATTTGHLELRAVPAVPPGSAPALSHGPGSVLGIHRRSQTPLDEAVPPGPGLRAQQREDQLVPGREAQCVR